MCLMLGSPGAGKTVLLKRLHACSNRGSFTDIGEAPSTIPTVGTNLGELPATQAGGTENPTFGFVELVVLGFTQREYLPQSLSIQ